MKLVKYSGYGIYKLTFDCEYLLKTYKGLYPSEIGLISRDENTVYHFDYDEKTYSICSKVTPSWSKTKCMERINKILPNTRCYLKTSYTVFEDWIDLGDGGPELLNWNMNKFQCNGMISNVWEPELYESHIIRFKEMNNVELNVNVFEDGRLVVTCFPVEKGISISDMEFESNEAKRILEMYCKINPS